MVDDGEVDARIPRKIKYRAMSPLYVGEQYRILMGKEDSEGKWKAEIWDSFGKIGMKGTIEE